jgi:hypothetical protein
MNTQSAVVNSGNVMASESVLWVGTTTVPDAINGRYCTASVTRDRDWMWVRFSQRPSEKYCDELKGLGFTFSSKRGGWHAPISELIVHRLNKWGAVTLTYQQLLSAMPPAKVERITGELNVEDGHINIVQDKAVRDALANKAKADKALEVAQAKAAAKAKAQEEKVASKPKTSTLALENENLRLQNENLKLQLQLLQMQQAQSVTQVSTPSVPSQHVTNGNGHYKVAGINLG